MLTPVDEAFLGHSKDRTRPGGVSHDLEGHLGVGRDDGRYSASYGLEVVRVRGSHAGPAQDDVRVVRAGAGLGRVGEFRRSEAHTSELPSLMRSSHAVFCW